MFVTKFARSRKKLVFCRDVSSRRFYFQFLRFLLSFCSRWREIYAVLTHLLHRIFFTCFEVKVNIIPAV